MRSHATPQNATTSAKHELTSMLQAGQGAEWIIWPQNEATGLLFQGVFLANTSSTDLHPREYEAQPRLLQKVLRRMVFVSHPVAWVDS